jgi:hypothetical protein
MLPGSFVQRTRKCGKPNCRCAHGERLHAEFLLSVLLDGKPRTIHVPLEMAEAVRSQVEQRKRFEQTAAQVARLNLRRFLRRREEK